MRTNSLSFRVYVTPEEKNRIVTSARDCRMSTSAFCRTLALGAMPTSKQDLVQVDKLARMVVDLNRLGNLMKLALTNRERFHEMGGDMATASIDGIVDLDTFDRVQVFLGNKSHNRHDSVYGNGLMTCGHCGRPIVCETKHKGGREYQYYLCVNYHKGDHPRERTTGAELDKHMLALFDRPKIEDRQTLQWLQRVIRAKAKAEVEDNTAQLHDINRQMGQINKDRDALLTLRMHGEIESATYARKDAELRNRMKRLKMRLDGQEQQKTEIGDTAMKVFELSQGLKNKWVKADFAKGASSSKSSV